jgi:hypothetical protein
VIVRPIGAKLERPSMLTAVPLVIVPGATTDAKGRCAADIAACVLSIPAPHVCVVQIHSSRCRSPAGTWQTVAVDVLLVGNGVAESFSSAMD